MFHISYFCFLKMENIRVSIFIKKRKKIKEEINNVSSYKNENV